MTRQTLSQRVLDTLTRNGFSYQGFFEGNSSFDVIARRENLVLILKVLQNIDALRQEHARDLQKLGHAFHAHSLVIGEKSKVYELQSGVVYERYQVPVLSLEGFDALLQSRFPLLRSFKGQQVVELDTEKLRWEREHASMTLKELSEAAGISLETLHRYEHGYPAQQEVAEKLEKILQTNLIRAINLFAYHPVAPVDRPSEIPDSALEQLRELGLKLSVFERAPVNAAGTEHPLLISHVRANQNPRKKAILLEKTRKMVKQPGLLISSSQKTLRGGDIPMVRADELSTFSSLHDILEAVHGPNAHLEPKKSKKPKTD